MTMEAETRDEAVQKLKDMMNAEAITAHMTEKHAGQPAMSVEDCHAMIEKEVQEVA